MHLRSKTKREAAGPLNGDSEASSNEETLKQTEDENKTNGASNKKKATNSAASTPKKTQKKASTSNRKNKKQKEQRLYCVCRRPEDEDSSGMIGCDYCDDWFHFRCVGLSAAQAKRIKRYRCPFCTGEKRRESPSVAQQPQPEAEPEEKEEEEAYKEEEEEEEEEPMAEEEEFRVENGTGRRGGSTRGSKTTTKGGSSKDRRRTSGTKRKLEEGSESASNAETETREQNDPFAFSNSSSNSSSATLKCRETVRQSLKEALSKGITEQERREEQETTDKEEPQEQGEHENKKIDQQQKLKLEDPGVMAAKIEETLFHMFHQETSKDYKAKFRLLFFNLKHEHNAELRQSVLSGEMDPAELCSKSSQELAPAELARWRKEREQKTFQQSVILASEATTFVKKTHKGEELITIAPTGPSLLASSSSSSSLEVSTSPEEQLTSATEAQSNDNADISSPVSSTSTTTSFSVSENVSSPPSSIVASELGEHSSTVVKPSANKKLKRSTSALSSSFSSSPSSSPLSSSSLSSSSSSNNNNKQNSLSRPSSSTGSSTSTADLVAQMELEPALDISLDDSMLSTTSDLDPSLLSGPSPPLSSPSPSSSSSSSLQTQSQRSSAQQRSQQRPNQQAHEEQGREIWRGCLSKANIDRFYVKSFLISGPHRRNLQHLLPDTLEVQGRVSLGKLAKYLLQLASSRSREHSILCLEPAADPASPDANSGMAYVAMLHYFSSKDRAGVVINLHGKIKEMYIIPLSSDDKHFRNIMTIEEGHDDKLIAVLVTERGVGS
ncbi:COMPASS (complex proteins associated with Set1p) component [Balamuthia mandrillaris]